VGTEACRLMPITSAMLCYVKYCVQIIIKIANRHHTHTSLILEVKADFRVSEQVGVLFLMEMCEPDGNEASNTFFEWGDLSRVNEAHH